MKTVSERLRRNANMCTRVNAAVVLLCETALVGANEIERLEKQRDELLAALREIADWTDRYTTPGHPISTVARTAIANAERQP